MKLVSRRTGMNGNDTKTIDCGPLRGFAWVGKGALFCLELLAMLTLVVVMTVLGAVILASVILPAPAARPNRVPGCRQDSGDASTFAAARKAVVS